MKLSDDHVQRDLYLFSLLLALPGICLQLNLCACISLCERISVLPPGLSRQPIHLPSSRCGPALLQYVASILRLSHPMPHSRAFPFSVCFRWHLHVLPNLLLSVFFSGSFFALGVYIFIYSIPLHVGHTWGCEVHSAILVASIFTELLKLSVRVRFLVPLCKGTWAPVVL